jgi:nucleoside-diphosphate-sugar epimerase
MRVLVVGGGGFIGSRITALLRSRAHNVLPCDRDPEALARQAEFKNFEIAGRHDRNIDIASSLSARARRRSGRRY